MTTQEPSKPHWSFWLIAAFALLWNTLGAVNFTVQQNAAAVAQMPETHQAIIIGRPLRATAGFAVSVFAGAIGGLLLLRRNRLANYLFIASLLGTAVTTIHTVAVATSGVEFGATEQFIMTWLPLIVAAVLVSFTKSAERQDWIR